MSNLGVYRSAAISILVAIAGLAGSTAMATTTSSLEEPNVAALPLTAQRRDPTQPPGAPSRNANSASVVTKSETRKPTLTSILLSDDRRLAIINDKLVREGERVAGMTLVRVSKDEVQLQGKNQARPLVLRLPKSNIGKDYR